MHNFKLSANQLKKIAQGMEYDFGDVEPSGLQTVPEYNQQEQERIQQESAQQKAEQDWLNSPEHFTEQVDEILQMITELDQTNQTQDQSISNQDNKLNQVTQYLKSLLDRVNKVEMEKEYSSSPKESPWQKLKKNVPAPWKYSN